MDGLHINPRSVNAVQKIPFLPIGFFKSHQVKTTSFKAETIFESSGTTGTINSKHYIRDIALYKENFTRIFELFYGNVADWCILGLLPSYLERDNSSLVMMVNQLILQSEHSESGFYLNDLKKLHHTLLHNEFLQVPTLLIGVTFALLDFAEKYPMKLKHTIVMETGGMKGRREEMIREEVHAELIKNLGVKVIHSEYGMTELLSQAYSKGNGRFTTPPWMKVLIRDEDDPLCVRSVPDNARKPATGFVNIIDMANIYSIAFIGTDDIGRIHQDGSFEILGRGDNSDIRGCSLMAI